MKGLWVVELGWFGSLLSGSLTNVEVALSLPAVLEVMDKRMANLTLWAKVQHQSEEKKKSSFLDLITKTQTCSFLPGGKGSFLLSGQGHSSQSMLLLILLVNLQVPAGLLKQASSVQFPEFTLRSGFTNKLQSH